MAQLHRRSEKLKAITIPSGSRKELDKGATVQIEGLVYPDYVGMGVRYAELVAQNVIPSNRLMILSAKRFLRMYAEATSGKGQFYWSDEHAVEVCAFSETLHHVKGVLARETLTLQPWQMWIRIAIYGFRWNDTGDRVVTIALEEITRKQGKSLDAATLALYEMCPNANFGDDIYIVAPTRDLANKVLEPMKKMIDINDELRNFYDISYKQEKIDVGVTDSYAVTLAAAGKKQDGHDPKVVIADEFHSLPASIFAVMKSSQGARPESLFLQIGSAGYNAFGVGWDERQTAIQVLEGKLDRPYLFAAIYTIDPEDFGEWTNERVIRKANPNAGVSTPMRKVMQEIDDALGDPRKRAEMLRTRFNIWGLGESKLIEATKWEACRDESLTLDKFKGERCFVGLDLASRNDLVAWACEFKSGDDYVFFARHYAPVDGIWREDEELRDLYTEWNRLGYLTFTPGSVHSYDDLIDDLEKLSKDHKVEMFIVDDREANAVMSALSKKSLPVCSFRKNATNYSEPTRDIQARVVGKFQSIRHDGNPVLAWNVDNVIAATDTAGLMLPKKVTPNSNMKIDGFDAMAQSHAGWLEVVDDSKMDRPNPMAERGMRFVE